MTTVVQTMMVPAGEGRELCVEIAGDGPAGTVLICAGSPNSRHLHRRWVDDALARGLRLVGYDRPGYGSSTPHPGRSVADGAQEIRAIARGLHVDRLAVWGFSGGGPHALACAALLPDLVCASGVVCSVAPYGAPGLDYFTGMGEDNEQSIRLMLADPEAARRKAHKDWEEALQTTADSLVEAWRSLLSPVDAAVATGEVAEFIVESTRDGLAPGDQGWWDDGVAHLSDWGFDIGSIRVPVKVWHGRQDRFVPFQHGQWLAAHVPGAQAALTEEDGHLTLVAGKAPEIHAWLAQYL